MAKKFVEENPEPSFEDFFKEALGEPTKEEPAQEEPEKEEPVKEEPENEEPEKEEPAKEEPVKEEPVKEEPAKEDPRIEALMKEIEALKAAQAKPVEEAKPAGPSADEVKAAEEAKAKMVEFEKDWPIHAEAMKLQQQVILSEVEKVLKTIVGPLFEQLPGIQASVNESAEERVVNAVKAVHPDCLELIPEVEKWIKELPTYLQVGANAALDGGSVQDVIDLLSDFKSARGLNKPEPKIEEPKKDPTENPRVKSMVDPKSSRTQKTSDVVAPDDFDGAFAAALEVVK